MRYDIVKNYLQIWSKDKIVLFLPANRIFSFTMKQPFSVWEISKCPGYQTQPRIKMYLVPHAKWHLQAIDFSGRLEVLWRDLCKRFSVSLHLQKHWAIWCCSAATLHEVQGNGGAGCPALWEAGAVGLPHACAAFLLLGQQVVGGRGERGSGLHKWKFQSFSDGSTCAERSTTVVLVIAPGSTALVQSAVISWLIIRTVSPPDTAHKVTAK